ncbi:uncharacterized protein BO97DRAFT_423570 [Aspergillus homomorphus CBS 101889]|uniref:Uncharacterized protein n=1 Tax=Aspergillus homomorphus (strain CBS 101889) TaxID=1450537 RepID=A0A395I4R4_ASPHC|nr:hypothetical protein BO97DRAFT_423570 [Aspergillus homomorphus CBS 101889]RAL13364.1 hypothetical protein BO97DRAFT_423570 [Aspergillus homomorphus CBS 101889]
MEDYDVRTALLKLQDAIRSWARKYAFPYVASLEGVANTELDLVVEELGPFSSETTWDSLTKKVSFSLDKLPAIIVQASLARSVFEWIFEDPFYTVEADAYTGVSPLSEGIGMIYDRMKEVDEVEAHAWRSQMLRLLCESSDRDAQLLLHSRIERLSSSLAQYFIRSPVHALLKYPESIHAYNNRFRELEDLFLRAANLALSLWTQRTDMACYSLCKLPQFQAEDTRMEAHRLHHLDDDDRRLDGRRIILFVQPAVIAFGSVHGEHYDQWKVWAAATVLVEGTTTNESKYFTEEDEDEDHMVDV